jgi:hypothetical protein
LQNHLAGGHWQVRAEANQSEVPFNALKDSHVKMLQEMDPGTPRSPLGKENKRI